MMIRVYVAGAYSADNVIDVLANIGRGEWYAAQLFAAGYAPFTPWHDKDFVIKLWDQELSVENFYEYSMAWLEVSDCVFVVPYSERSTGVKKEIERAHELGIPIFYTFIGIDGWRREKEG